MSQNYWDDGAEKFGLSHPGPCSYHIPNQPCLHRNLGTAASPIKDGSDILAGGARNGGRGVVLFDLFTEFSRLVF